MDPVLILQLVVVLLLVMGNAFFVASEIALTSARRSRITQLAETEHAAARIVQQLHAQPERFYSVTQIAALPNTATIRDALEVFRQSKHSRFPVYKDTIDTIIGTLFVKELLECIDPCGGPASLERLITEIMRPAYVVPEAKPISVLLARFRAKRQQMAIVADEFGGTAGLVTLEDILEEIVGEYEDEASLKTEIIRRRTDDGCFFVDPSARLDDLGVQIGYDFQPATYNSLAGLVYGHLGRVAQAGDRVELQGLEIVVEATDGHRLVEVRLKKLAPNDRPEDEAKPE